MELPRHLVHKIFWIRKREDAAVCIQRAWRDWAKRIRTCARAILGELERIGRSRVHGVEACIYVHAAGDQEASVRAQANASESVSTETEGWFALAESEIWWRPHRVTPATYKLLVGMVSIEGSQVLCTVWRNVPGQGMVACEHHCYRRRRLRNGQIALARIPTRSMRPTDVW